MSDMKVHPNWRWLGDCLLCGEHLGLDHECKAVPMESDKQAAPVSGKTIHNVKYQPVGRYIRDKSGMFHYFKNPSDVPAELREVGEWHSETCDCLYCKRYRCAQGWTPLWWKDLLESGQMPLDYVERNFAPYQDGTYGTGDRVFLGEASDISNDRNVSAGEVKRYAYSSIPPCYQSPSAKGMFVLEADHLSIVAALQSRIATLEAERDAAIREVGTTNRALGKSESELAAFKDSLPERANAESLNAWSAKIHVLNAKWWVDLDTGAPLKRNVGELLMLCVSELAEAMEGDRKNLMDDKLPHRKMFEVELADCMIRIFDIAAGFGLDLGAAVVEKCEYNKTRADHQPEARNRANGKKY